MGPQDKRQRPSYRALFSTLRGEFRVPARRSQIVFAPVLAIGLSGCTSEPAPPSASPAESAEVYCGTCAKKVSRQSAESQISPEGLDVYLCKSCLARPSPGKPRSSPP